MKRYWPAWVIGLGGLVIACGAAFLIGDRWESAAVACPLAVITGFAFAEALIRCEMR